MFLGSVCVITFIDHLLYLIQVLGTHYLELYSDKAQVETDKAIAKEFLNEGGFVRRVFGNVVCVLKGMWQ